jgi:hypothetical protein
MNEAIGDENLVSDCGRRPCFGAASPFSTLDPRLPQEGGEFQIPLARTKKIETPKLRNGVSSSRRANRR